MQLVSSLFCAGYQLSCLLFTFANFKNSHFVLMGRDLLILLCPNNQSVGGPAMGPVCTSKSFWRSHEGGCLFVCQVTGVMTDLSSSPRELDVVGQIYITLCSDYILHYWWGTDREDKLFLWTSLVCRMKFRHRLHPCKTQCFSIAPLRTMKERLLRRWMTKYNPS